MRPAGSRVHARFERAQEPDGSWSCQFTAEAPKHANPMGALHGGCGAIVAEQLALRHATGTGGKVGRRGAPKGGAPGLRSVKMLFHKPGEAAHTLARARSSCLCLCLCRWLRTGNRGAPVARRWHGPSLEAVRCLLVPAGACWYMAGARRPTWLVQRQSWQLVDVRTRWHRCTTRDLCEC